MISLAPNQRLEVIPTASVKLRYAADTQVFLDATETRGRTVTALGYEAVASPAARVLAPTAPAGDRTVTSFRIACVDFAAITFTLRRVTVPPVLVGQTWPGEQIEVLDTVTLGAGNQLFMEGGDAGWSVRVPAGLATIPVPPADDLIAISSGGGVVWDAGIPFSMVGSRPTTLAGYGIVDAQPLDDDLTSLSALTTNGMISRTGDGTYATRTITGTAGQITVTNGSGISGSPVISLPATITLALTFQAANAITTRAAATQDGIILAGRAGGTSSWAVTLTPASLSANRTITLPNETGTIVLRESTTTTFTATTASTSVSTGVVVVNGGVGVAGTLTLNGTAGNTLRLVSGTANGTVATTLGSVGPTGSTAGNPQGWFRINIAGTDRFIPYW